VHGTEVLRKHQASDPPAPAPTPAPSPTPPPPPAPGPNPYHVPPGPLTTARAQEVVFATANEFAGLTAPRPTESAARDAGEELLRRMIWHLQLAGYQAGRQRNPSGAVSGDKLTIFIDGAWHAFDVFIDYGAANQTTRVGFGEVTPANPLPDSGIAD